MNDQDYIQLFMEKGAYRTDLWRQHIILDASEDTVIAFAKEVEARVLEEIKDNCFVVTSQRAKSILDGMIAERRGK